jgi:hypothetical protein
MTIRLKKCLLSLQINCEDELQFNVTPNPCKTTRIDNEITYEFNVDIHTPSTIKINLTRRLGGYAHILIKSFKVDGVEILLSRTVIYKTAAGQIKNSHNFLDEVGTLQLKIHSNPISQNFLNYLLDLTNS